MASNPGGANAELVWSARLVDQALTKAAVVQQVVRDVQAQTGPRFPGVARNLQQLHPPLEEVQARLDALGGQARTLAAQAEVENEAIPDEVVAALTLVKGGIDTAFTAANGVLDQLDRVSTLVARCLEGGSPEDLLYLVDQVRIETREAMKALRAADKMADVALTAARKAGKA